MAHGRSTGSLADLACAVQVLTPAQAAIMFTLAEDELVEPLHITNIVALNRGVIQLLPMCREEVANEHLAVGADDACTPSAGCDPACVPADCGGDCGTETVCMVPPPVA